MILDSSLPAESLSAVDSNVTSPFQGQGENSVLTQPSNNSSALSDPITLIASGNFLDDTTQAQKWDDGVMISAFSADGSAAEVEYGWDGLSVKGDRYNYQIDFDPITGKSEQLVLDFKDSVTKAEIELGRMGANEWKGLAETGRWTIYDGDGNEVASGALDPKTAEKVGKSNYRFGIDAPAFERLVIEATAYGNGVGSDRTNNNSDFNLRSLTYTLGAMSDDIGGDNSGGNSPENTDSPDNGNTGTDDSPTGLDDSNSNDENGATDDSGSNTDETSNGEDSTAGGETDDGMNDGMTNGDMHGGIDDGMNDGMTGTILWSEINPQADEQVVVSAGQTIIVDQDTANLAGVIVNGGSLIFSENFTDTNGNGDLDFTADWLLVRNGGYLEIGTESDSYDADVTITLDGADEDVMNMGMGGRFIIAAGTAADGTESTISMHGVDGEKVSWTQLSAHADKGSKVITLAEAVDWEVGDEIVIAPSGFDANEAEKRKIVAVNGNKVTLDRALEYDHFGEIETVAGKPLDMRAEVGLLSRNIDIQGAKDSLESEFGAHMMFMDGSSIEISGIEVRQGGQKGKKARYPIHWHLGGDHAGDYVKNSSIYDSFQRGIVTHGVDNVEVDSNVVYNVFGHGYVFSEDGNEENNSFTNNLGVLIKNRESSSDFSFFNADQQGQSTQAEHRSAVFWGRNYYNPMVDNHAAGTLDGNGFHFDIAAVSRKNKEFKNSTAPITFDRNFAHSNSRDRLKLSNYSPIATGNGLMIADLRSKPSSESEIVFDNFTSYKNVVGGAWIEEDRQVLRGAMLADNSSGVIMKSGKVQNTTITHQSSNEIGGVYGVDRELVLSGSIHVLLGKAEAEIKNISFVNTIGAAIHIERETQVQEGSTISEIQYVNNKPIPLYWKGKDNTNPGALTDLDSSFLGTGISSKIFGPDAAGIDKTYFDEKINAYVVPLE